MMPTCQRVSRSPEAPNRISAKPMKLTWYAMARTRKSRPKSSRTRLKLLGRFDVPSMMFFLGITGGVEAVRSVGSGRSSNGATLRTPALGLLRHYRVPTRRAPDTHLLCVRQARPHDHQSSLDSS